MWHAFGAGASLLSTYRYRHPLRGSEMYHEGIVGTDGVTLTRTGGEWIETMRAIRAAAQTLTPTATLPAPLAARRTALLWSHDNFWDLEIQPQTTEWKTWGHRNTYTMAVKSTGAPLDFVGEGDDFARYPFVVAPAYQLVSDSLVARWRRYVEQGGHLLLTSRSGTKNPLGHFREGAWAAAIRDLIGADVEGFDVLPPGVTASVERDGRRHAWHRWGDILAPRPGTQVLATYADGYRAGKAAATSRALGRGTVTMIGVTTDDGALERALVRAMYQRAGVAIEDLPPGVFLEWREGVYVAVNYNPAAFSLALPAGAEVLVGSTPLKPAGVLVWRVR
jgi:beta-galactosidase